MKLRIPKHDWKQVGGDMNPGAHGGIIARADGDHIEIIEIQPVRAYVSDGEAAQIGYPFWSRGGWFDLDDLDLSNADVQSAMKSWGYSERDLEKLDPDVRATAIAEMLLSYGRGDEGLAGWSDDVVPGPVVWWGSKKPQGAEYLADEDEDFRRDVLEEDEDDED